MTARWMIQGSPEAQTMMMAIFCGLAALVTGNQRYTASEHRGSILRDYAVPAQIYRQVLQSAIPKINWSSVTLQRLTQLYSSTKHCRLQPKLKHLIQKLLQSTNGFAGMKTVSL